MSPAQRSRSGRAADVTGGPLLEVTNLIKHFPSGGRKTVKAVNDISFHINRGEALALVGESGSGKTTVGRCILRLIEPTAGQIVFAGKQVDTMKPEALRAIRPRVQMVFQEPYDSLNPRMRIKKIVEEPILLAGGTNAAHRYDRVAEVLEMVRLGTDAMNKYPHQFSAGEQQRIGIARAMATEPDLIVLDEPTSALDVSVRAEILDLLMDLQKNLGLSYLLISHDLTAVRRVCHRVAIMYLGKIVERGNTEEIFRQPLHPYSRALLSSVLYPDPDQHLSRFVLSGEIPSPIDLPPGCHLYRRCPWAIDTCNDAYPPADELFPGHQVACFRALEKAEPTTNSTTQD
jgi:oligopeptide/dipeptide ABC transporter ATP-binding protein